MNRYNFSFPAVFLLLGLITSSTFAQAPVTITDRLTKQLDSLSKSKAVASIYLQTSKGIYETEEDVWFKAYALNSQLFTPSTLDTTLYVQLIQEETNKTVWQEKYEIENGFVDGHLYLQDSLQAGSYILTAYSSHSFYKETKRFYAVRKLRVVKKIEQKTIPIHQKKKDQIIDFKVFPEGGNLISGMVNKLAFKAVNSRGEPVFISGTLYENDKPIVAFKSLHAGLGSLDFTPDIDKKYHIKLTEPEKDKHYALPEIKRGGISLRLIKTTKESLLFQITQNAKYAKGNVYFRLQIRGIVYCIATAELNNNLKIRVPLKDLPQGVAEVTLYNNNFVPICERLVYVNQDRKLNIKTTISNLYNIREKITLKINVTDKNKKPVIAHLGLSIYDNIYQNTEDTKNIFTHYYLSTQLRGKIYNPAYYFNKENKDRNEALNLLLLTQGWRSYTWDEKSLEQNIVSKNQILFDGIKGVVRIKKRYDKKNKKPLGQPVLMAFIPDKEEFKYFIALDSMDEFVLTPQHLKMGERGYVYLKLFTSQKDKFYARLKDDCFKTINTLRKSITVNYPLANSNNEEKYVVTPYISTSDVILLEEVMIIKKRMHVKRDKYLGKLDSLAKLEMITDYVCEVSDILNCPNHPKNRKSRVPVEGKVYLELMVWTGDRFEKEIPSLNRPFKNPPLPPYHYPVLTDEYLLSRFNLIRTKGYYGKKEFYQPNYDKDTLNSSFTDFRNTLLWNPAILTDKNGEATVTFFCSDINTKFIGTIEGVSKDGLLGSKSFEFVIKK